MTKRAGSGEPENHHMHHGRSQPHTSWTIEWPTWGLIAVCYGGWLTLTYAYHSIPLWIFAPCTAYIVALHSSLQHEILHGHPTRNATINEVMVYFPLGLFVPYRRFRNTHLRHHCDERLTDPYDDPESWYVCPEKWGQSSGVIRLLLRINATLGGRLIIGPGLAMFGLLRQDARDILSGKAPLTARAWLHHVIGLVVVSLWLVGICGMNLWTYIFCTAYPGMSLLLIRSYAEHRASEDPNHRTAIIEASPFFSLLFLNNNLHYVHHQRPRVPWYDLPRLYRASAEEFHVRNAGYGFCGYGDLFRRHFFRAHDDIVHPLSPKERKQ